MSRRPCTAALVLLTALGIGAPFAARAGCEGRMGTLIPVSPTAGVDELPPALAELIAHHRGDFGTGVTTSHRAAPPADPEPTHTTRPPDARVAVVAPVAFAR